MGVWARRLQHLHRGATSCRHFTERAILRVRVGANIRALSFGIGWAVVAGALMVGAVEASARSLDAGFRTPTGVGAPALPIDSERSSGPMLLGADTLRLGLERLAESLTPVEEWMGEMEGILRVDSGSVRADSIFLRMRGLFQREVRGAVARFDDERFQALVWPDGFQGQRLRREEGRFDGPSPAEFEMADSIRAFLAERGIATRRSEGNTYFTGRDAVLLERFGRFLTESTRAFLRLMALEESRPTADDGALMIPLEELARRVALSDACLQRFPEAAAIKPFRAQHERYLDLFIGGLPNSRPFDWDTQELLPEWHQSYERYLTEHGDLPSAQVVAEYLRLLEANGFRRTTEVGEYLRARWRAAHDRERR